MADPCSADPRFGKELYALGDPEAATESALASNVANFARTTHPSTAINLIVGRGTNHGKTWWSSESEQDPPSSTDDVPSPIWVPLDKFGGAFTRPNAESHPIPAPLPAPAPHLWMDFNDTSALQLLPEAIFTAVVVDWSTFRYLRPLAPRVSASWARILRPGGSLAFEGGIASIAVVGSTAELQNGVGSLGCEFENPCHATVDSARAQNWIEESRRRTRTENPGTLGAGAGETRPQNSSSCQESDNGDPERASAPEDPHRSSSSIPSSLSRPAPPIKTKSMLSSPYALHY
ncbi:hypothetical protein BDK51DRAFT_49629 [Blyttiomyces helicus]|uniref:Uncharacterized protein n=1 Tax=Blyttiomyces helicus TaxID=388810 RepID=A0A4P9WPH1_9FUNG|nr:hypothetical protein BDK51DRAFT_49629 [Blyttiomyces helicus]|eukprot:RKO93638.1 hypothetical protein BDK51DRAFT_49629 [Blyttiomyces helicus]